MENGIGGGGASDLGEDHFVPIDPLATNQVEVIRGPATLRYGSQSIGGVVNVTNNRIPDLRSRSRGVLTEIKGGLTTVDNGLEGAVLLDAGKGNFAFHADAFSRTGDDYRIPRYPYLFPPDPRPGRQRQAAELGISREARWVVHTFSTADSSASPSSRTTACITSPASR